LFAIEINNLEKQYSGSKNKALEPLTLNVKSGTIFSLLGANGAGKTTLIKLLLSIIEPTGGNAKIFGIDIRDYKSHSKLGYLPENHRFPEFLNATQVLYYYGKMSGLSNEYLNKKMPELLESVKLTNVKDTMKIKKYSKGMLQRLGMAQALINEPDILFLDEPTDGIDPIGRKEIRDILTGYKNQGKTIFINSHLLSEVEKISDEIVILKQGKMVKRGTIEDFTSLKNSYQFKFKDFDFEGNYEINQLIKEINTEYSYENELLTIHVEDDIHLNKVIDILRSKNVIITSVIPQKISLEDFFIKTMES